MGLWFIILLLCVGIWVLLEQRDRLAEKLLHTQLARDYWREQCEAVKAEDQKL